MTEEITTAVSPPPAPVRVETTHKAETFSREYVSELREENKSWRLKLQEAETARQAAADLAKKAKEEADEAVKAAKEASKAEAKAAKEEATKAADQRIIRAELRVEAIKAGIVDLDGLKLVDASELKLDDNGEVQGAAEAIANLKETKAYLFKTPSPGSSNPDPAPKPGDKTPKMARDMTEAEREAALAKIRKAGR